MGPVERLRHMTDRIESLGKNCLVGKFGLGRRVVIDRVVLAVGEVVGVPSLE